MSTIRNDLLNPLRLGNERRNRRDYSLHQRISGKTANDRIYEKEILEILELILLMYFTSRSDQNLLLQMIIFYLIELEDINEPRLAIPDEIPRLRNGFNSFSDQEFVELFGFPRDQVILLYDSLSFPEYLLVGSDAHSFRVDSVHAFLYTLFRLHSPSARQSLDSSRWYYDYSTLSKIFNTTILFLDNHYGQQLRILPEIPHKFNFFNQCIITNLNNLYPNENVPDDATNCALFVDGVRFRVSRPSGGWFTQKAAFNYHKWFHCYGSQGIFGPDGMCYDWYDFPLGKYNDKHFMANSNVTEIMEQIQQPFERKYWLYGDKGYDSNEFLRCSAHGPAFVSDEQHHDNYKMSRERVSVEWGFGKIKSLFPFLQRPELLKLQQSLVASYIRVGVFLANCHTCMNGSETSLYFNCDPPSLAEYLNYLAPN